MKRFFYCALFISFLLLLAACSQQGTGGEAGESGAEQAVAGYIQALATKDGDRLSTLSCAAWEENARSELESFGSVTTELEGPDCQESGKDGEVTLVSCTGKITANYGNEVLEIILADQTYQAVFENGEWRMCGYH